LFVSDQDRANDFYLNKLGMDAPLAPNSTARWLSVAPKDALTELETGGGEIAGDHIQSLESGTFLRRS
jgi:hypothetical protein